MTIAIPVADGRLCMHFGHCDRFALVEVDETQQRVVGTSYLTPPPHEPGVLPQWLHQHGVRVVIAGGMGRRAMELFRVLGIRVIPGAPADSPEPLVAAFLSGTLQTGQNVCDH